MLKILNRYLFRSLLINYILILLILTLLFLIFDFFERIDNLVKEGTDIFVTLQYFACKIPFMVHLMIPFSMVIACVFTFGILSKNNEITAMRAAGLRLSSLSMPPLLLAVGLYGISLLLSEKVVPYFQRRSKEIYNLDIRKKDVRGGLSQKEIWWRDGDNFYRVGFFDSRDKTLRDVEIFKVSEDFDVVKHASADRGNFVRKEAGWGFSDVREFNFRGNKITGLDEFQYKSVPIHRSVKDFYNLETDPYSMTFKQLRDHIEESRDKNLLVSLYEKLAFPLSSLAITLLVIPFSFIRVRSNNLSRPFFVAIGSTFCYYTIHSLSIACGKGELLSPLVAANLTNLLFLSVGGIMLFRME